MTIKHLAAGVGFAVLTMTGIGGVAVADDKPTIYIIAPSSSDDFWITQRNGAAQAAKDFNANVIVQAPPQDTGDAGMVPLLQAAIAAKPAGIAIDYTSKTMEAATVAALDAGIPVVLYNNNRFEGDNKPSDPRIQHLAFVGQDESKSGEVLTKAWLPMLPSKPCKILVVDPFPTAFVLTLRGDGVKRVLDAAGYPHSDLAATDDQNQNLSLISAAVQADPSICGIAALGGPAANPAARLITQNKLKISVSTFDVGPETAARIKDGGIAIAINQQPFLQSYYAASDIAQWVRYSLSMVNVDTGTSLVTKDNVDIVKACLDAGHC